MNSVEVTKLSGSALDYAMAKAVGVKFDRKRNAIYINDERFEFDIKWQPSRKWGQAGFFMEKKDVAVCPNYIGEYGNKRWTATCHGSEQEGGKAIIAVCRSIVASHFGDTVEIPKDLI